MREIAVHQITEVVSDLCISANFNFGEDTIAAYKKALENEKSPVGREVLNQILENAEIARTEKVPACQDTGTAVFFLELGQDAHIVGGDLTEAVEKGVEIGYREGYLRKSMCDPFTRKNTSTNLPAVIHTEIVPGDTLKISMAAKGGGAENMSVVRMMKPADGREGVVEFVLDWVKQAGPNPCPPTTVGVGIGGNFEKSAILAKKALLREVGDRNPDPEIAGLEEDLLEKINCLGVGPMGLGGWTTSFDVRVEYMPCHIASLPVAININCHSSRHKEAII